MKLVKTEDAVGQVICHDITQIIKGETKGPVFRKGHVVTKEDIPVLLGVGKQWLYIWEKEEGMLHEDEAAEILCSLCLSDHMSRTEAKEGKIEIKAEMPGVLKVDRDLLYQVNSFGQMMIATRLGDTMVLPGDVLAGTRIIPLVIRQSRMEELMRMAKGRKVLKLLLFRPKKVGVITTGSEVYSGRIKDTFTPVIEEKIAPFGMKMTMHQILDDNHEEITKEILRMIEAGADMVCVTGGMSVDPDDRTPLAIKNTGADIVSYGAPVLPGAMFLLSYYRRGTRLVPVVGLPGCVMYAKRTIFDLVLPRLAADDVITKEELAALGEGGLCLNCDLCTYPNCGFGKGRR